MGFLLLILLLLFAFSILFFRMRARKSFLKGREPKQLKEIYAEIPDQISFSVFNEVWSKVGEAFSIDPRLIKPDDTLKALSSIDSWDLGKGDDALSEWVGRENLGKLPTLTTMLDFAKWIQTTKYK
ncbi:MAG: hypothetical protein ACTHNE_19870 [Dyella sp.]|uniref:hypothetical protein n=1 Tax=Dyella sp. TaxID=1869338 RepID=UPI003F7F8A3E